MAYNVVTKSKRAPTIAVPGSKGSTRPAAQKGGGGNKAAGSVEPTAANTPTVSVSPTGQVTTEHLGPSPAQVRKARVAKQAARQSRRRVRKVVRYVKQRDKELTPKREVHVSKAFLDRQASPKPVTVSSHTRGKTPVVEHARSLPSKPESPLIAKGYTKAEREVLKEGGVKVPQAPKGPELKGTPQERKAARSNLIVAKKQLAKAKPTLEADLGPEQRQFVEGVAKETGLRPATIAAQARAEESEGAQTEAEQTHNFLNMGPGTRYSSLKEGIDATASNYNNTASSNYAGVRATRGQSAAEQARAIAESPWGTGPLIEQTLAEVKESPGNPKAIKNYKAAVKEAKELGLRVGRTGIQNPGKPSKQTVTKFQQIKHAANELESKDFPYSWGGGHNADFSPGGEEENGGPGYDCSGAVSFVLHQAGVLKEPLTSGSMGTVLEPGPGAVTVFYNGEHTFMKIGNEYWGTSVGDAGAGGIGKHPTPSPDYLSQYSVGHVPGLGRKQALQLGFKPGSFVSEGGTASAFPGMTFSEGGTTATIEQGAGTKVDGKAKFSKKPIQLTPLQEVRRNVRGLREKGVEVSGPFSEAKGEAQPKGETSLHSQLAALEKRYSIGAV